jgi:hypothetical protein
MSDGHVQPLCALHHRWQGMLLVRVPLILRQMSVKFDYLG